MSDPRVLVVTQKSVDFTLFSVKWVPSSSRLVAIGSHPRGTGVWQVYNMSKGELTLLDEVCIFMYIYIRLDHAIHPTSSFLFIIKVVKPHAIKCGTFAASSLEDRHLAIGDFSGNLSLW